MSFALRQSFIHVPRKNYFHLSSQTSKLKNYCCKTEDTTFRNNMVLDTINLIPKYNNYSFLSRKKCISTFSSESTASFPVICSKSSSIQSNSVQFRNTIRYLHLPKVPLNESNFETVTLSEIKRFLRKYELPFEDGYTCLHIDCPFCKREPTRRKKMIFWGGGKLYINKTTGFFVCLNCTISGSWKNLQDLVAISKSGQSFSKSSLNFLKEEDVSIKLTAKLSELRTNSTEISKLTEEDWGEISRKLGIEELKKSVFELYEGRCSLDQNQILLPIFSIDKKLLGYTIIAISEKTGKPEEFNIPKTCNELFGWKPVLDAFSSYTSKTRQIILVSSVLDALTAVSSTSHVSLSLPPKFNHLPQEYLPKLEHFNTITIWFGNNLQSWEAAKSFGRKLGEKRCRLVRPEEDHPSPFIALQNNLNVNNIYNAAQIMEHKAITTFSKLRSDVFSELTNCEQVAGVKWTRYPSLNKLMKGHRRGELTILTGSTGCGKTTFMSEYSLDLCVQGVNTLWGSFEIRNVRLAKTMLTQFAEKNLEDNVSEYDKWADQFEQLPLYFMTFHGQQNIKAVLDAMTHAAYVYDIAHIIVDNLQFMLGVSDTAGADRFWKQDLVVAAFRKFATVNNCHVSLVMHPRKEESSIELSNNSIFGGAKASQEADNILILQDRRLTSPRGKKYLQLSKNRFSGDLGMFALEFDKETLSFSGRKKQKPTTGSDTKQSLPQNPDSQNTNREFRSDVELIE